MYKRVTVSFPPEYYRELQWLKKYFGLERWRDPEFIRWLIHKLYNKLQSKVLDESLDRGR